MKLFRHYKNLLYKYVGVVKHSESLEEMVLYETLYENPHGRLFVRPKDMFHETLEKDEKTFERFKKVPLEVKYSTDLNFLEFEQINELIEKVFGSLDEEAFQGVVKNRRNFLLVKAFIEGELVGFKLGYQHDHETFYSWLGAIDPKFRGLGIASELMKFQHDWCLSQGFKKIQTKTKNKWKEMIILNIKSGFQIIGSYTDEHGETKLILEKELI